MENNRDSEREDVETDTAACKTSVDLNPLRLSLEATGMESKLEKHIDCLETVTKHMFPKTEEMPGRFCHGSLSHSSIDSELDRHTCRHARRRSTESPSRYSYEYLFEAEEVTVI